MTHDAERLTVGTDPELFEHTGELRRHWFALYLYEDVESLQRAAKRYRHGGQDWTRAAACVQGRYAEPPRSGNGYCGVIRLAREALTTETASHEAVHAAAVVFRQARAEVRLTPRIDLGRDVGSAEEAFAYLAGALTRQITNALYDCGAWSLDQTVAAQEEL